VTKNSASVFQSTQKNTVASSVDEEFVLLAPLKESRILKQAESTEFATFVIEES
jgi:hypothetical protein